MWLIGTTPFMSVKLIQPWFQTSHWGKFLENIECEIMSSEENVKTDLSDAYGFEIVSLRKKDLWIKLCLAYKLQRPFYLTFMFEEDHSFLSSPSTSITHGTH